MAHLLEAEGTHLDFRKYLLANIDNPTEGHFTVCALLFDSFLSSKKDRWRKDVVST